ncbi:GNAT family N-acetyltransferase [Agromyces sp. H66]|uniref:GNAT family N-acetyltransferase n=1 Tax=Agromyces sp. H66 TaxID=2529859 RepID=UPI0010A9F79B|nr:GNAT family N-acetyltransferase [Agromyces sp. H66]
MSVEVRPIPVPHALGTPDSAEFEAYADLGFALERANWGHDHFADSAARLLAMHRHAAGRGHAEFAAWDGAVIVGRAGLAWELTAGSETVELTLGVLPSHRRRGIGSRLLVAAEEHARELGRAKVVAYSDHPDDGAAPTGPVVRAPDGDAVLAASAPANAFAEARGYSLGQLERISSIRVPGRIEAFRAELGERLARAEALGYRLARWTDRAPAGLVDAYAAARARMALDVPAGGLTIDEEHWDAVRVREYESRELDGDTSLLVSAVVTDDGEIAGYTELELPRERDFAYQFDTLVVGAHRGHGLGMLVKLANLVRLAEVAPQRAVVYTWNADENAHMLAINVGLGFRRCGLEAVWQRAGDAGGAHVTG